MGYAECGLRNIRNEVAVDEDARFEPGQVQVFAKIVFGELADVRILPAMERDIEGRAGAQSRHKASHGREAVRTVGVGELCRNNERVSE